MIKLSEQLSEFSFGYGVTNEAQKVLNSVGWHAVPFLPNLVNEKEVGFDVAFGSPGAVLMLQFKLGEQLTRFRRTTPTQPIPVLHHPFWRFLVHTGKHQFLRLWSYEVLGADVYYVAPRFATWTQYQRLFLRGDVLEHSLLVTPSDIKKASPGPAAEHRVVYDQVKSYVCSNPIRIPGTSIDDLTKRLAGRASADGNTLARTVKRLLEPGPDVRPLPRLLRRQRRDLRARARTPVEGDAAIIALEAWLQGAQTVFVGEKPES